MFSDSGLLFWTFVTLAATFGVPAYQSEGPKARNLWIATGLCVILALLVALGALKWGPLLASFATTTLRVIWMLYPLITVVVVSILIRDLRPKRAGGTDLAELVMEGPKLPPFALGPAKQSAWTPNIPFKNALIYLRVTVYEPGRYVSMDDVKSYLIGALDRAKVSSWGKAHPKDSEFFEIMPRFWELSEVTVETNVGFSRGLSLTAYDVHLSKEQLELVWPPKADQEEA